MNELKSLRPLGQSAWFDYIRRDMILNGDLARMVAEDDLGGVTSNPAIFEKAIAGSTDYDHAITALVEQRDREAKEIYEEVAIHDVQDAADILHPVYRRTRRGDGYVSLEVSPYLARDTAGTLAEARRLWRAVGRENVMIKVPATPEGIPAIAQLIGEGINVNVTLLFAQEAYERVAEAYQTGVEALAKRGGDPSRVASVASFFVSRIDTLVDAEIEKRLATEKDSAKRALLGGLAGKVAIANARLAYQSFKKLLAAPRWKALESKGAMPQRMLWASTGTKNPKYRDVIYVEELIGAHTVNTLPPATFDAFRDHGKARASLEESVDGARKTMEQLAAAGISMQKVTSQLLDEGVKLFADAFDRLLAVVARKRQDLLAGAVGGLSYKLPDPLSKSVASTLEEWRARGNVRRLWARDASLWTGNDEGAWLAWLDIAAVEEAHVDELTAFAREIRDEGFRHVLLLGMGGSSLCPEVVKRTFGAQEGWPELEVLDSTDPAQIAAFERKLDLARTLCIVSSKSGSTLEPNIFQQYFWERVRQAAGDDRARRSFVAITDPGSALEAVARKQGFRRIFSGVPAIGGRYSALSRFGLVPLSVMGLDPARFLARTRQMVHSCAASVPPLENPGVILGAVLGVAAKDGRDKLTLVASPGISGLGAWLEQLIAESTGKNGRGIIPVDCEPTGAPKCYGNDRLFVYLRLESAPSSAQDREIETLEKAGQPVVRIAVPDLWCLGQEFYRFEIATAVAGAVLGVNPFDQPDVEASKLETRKLTTEYEKSGRLPAETPLLRSGGLTFLAEGASAAALAGARDATSLLETFLGSLGEGDYVALLAYIEMTAEHESALAELRTLIRDRKRVATSLGFGPRFLHSTGQAYKGGPPSGVFLQITGDDAKDLPVPDRKYTFGVVKSAQAAGDLRVLVERGRRALRVHLPRDVRAGLRGLLDAAHAALGGKPASAGRSERGGQVERAAGG